MKKIVLSIFALILFFGFGFAADYAAGCVNGKVQGYSCDVCNGTMHLIGTYEVSGNVQFYNKCCDGTPYDEEFGEDESFGALCCESGNEVYQKDDGYYDCRLSCGGTLYGRNLDKCCPSPGVTYNPANNGNNKDCCEGALAFDTTQDICCSYGTFWDTPTRSCISCEIVETIPDGWQDNCNAATTNCDPAKKYTLENGTEVCCPGMMVPNENNGLVCITNTQGDMGINMNTECLLNGQCSYNIYETLGIRKSDQNPSVTSFVQDIILAVTMFIGTVVSIVLVVSGILYVVAGIQGNSSTADTAKKGIINSLIGLLLVVASYSIVRLIQFLATAGGG